MNLTKLRNSVKRKNISWNKHSFERLLERSISRSDVLKTILNGEIIKEYSDDKPFPSALILGWINTIPLHVVVALDENSEICHIITAYYPDEKIFENDYKTRRTK